MEISKIGGGGADWSPSPANKRKIDGHAALDPENKDRKPSAPENEEAAKSRNETRQIEKERKTAVKTEGEEERTEGSEERGNLEKPTTYFQLISVLTDPENRAK